MAAEEKAGDPGLCAQGLLTVTAMDEKISLALKLLLCCRNELYSLYPFLDGAFASLPYGESGDTQTIGTQ